MLTPVHWEWARGRRVRLMPMARMEVGIITVKDDGIHLRLYSGAIVFDSYELARIATEVQHGRADEFDWKVSTAGHRWREVTVDAFERRKVEAWERFAVGICVVSQCSGYRHLHPKDKRGFMLHEAIAEETDVVREWKLDVTRYGDDPWAVTLDLEGPVTGSAVDELVSDIRWSQARARALNEGAAA